MKLSLDGWRLKVEREPGDPRYTQGGYAGGAAAESRFLYHVKQELQKLGLDVIKKRMWRDGHLKDDEQQYLRTRSAKSPGPHVYIYNDAWAVYDAGEKFNQGVVWLDMTFDVFSSGVHGAEEQHRQMFAEILAKGVHND